MTITDKHPPKNYSTNKRVKAPTGPRLPGTAVVTATGPKRTRPGDPKSAGKWEKPGETELQARARKRGLITGKSMRAPQPPPKGPRVTKA